MKFYQHALLCVIAVAMTAGQASAQWGGCGMGGFYGGYNGFAIQPYVAAPPYFAMHPPVYYGKRYTRPYGVSPFAAPPQLQTNGNYAPAPHVERSLTLTNPYAAAYVVPQAVPHMYPSAAPEQSPQAAPSAPEPVAAPAASPVVQHQPVKPLVIENPYFQSPSALVNREIN